MLGKVFFEIPTGFIADKYGKKLIACLSCIIFAIYYFLYAIFENFYFLVFSQLLYALGMAAIAGALEGWIITSAKEEFPHNSTYVNYFGHLRRQIVGLGNMFSGPLGAVFANYFGYNLVYLVASIVSLSLFFCFYEIKEKENKSVYNHIRYIKESFKCISERKNTSLKYTICICLLTVIYQPLYFFWQPLFSEVILNDYIFTNYSVTNISGIVFFISSLFIFVFNKKIKNYILLFNDFKLNKILIIFCFSAFIFFQLISTLDNNLILSIIFFGLIHSSMSIIATILDDQYFKYIETKFFSTIYSIVNVFQNIVASLFWILINKFIVNTSVHKIYSLTSIMILILILFIFFFKKNYLDRNI